MEIKGGAGGQRQQEKTHESTRNEDFKENIQNHNIHHIFAYLEIWNESGYFPRPIVKGRRRGDDQEGTPRIWKQMCRD